VLTNTIRDSACLRCTLRTGERSSHQAPARGCKAEADCTAGLSGKTTHPPDKGGVSPWLVYSGYSAISTVRPCKRTVSFYKSQMWESKKFGRGSCQGKPTLFRVLYLNQLSAFVSSGIHCVLESKEVTVIPRAI
jgi:hypothetical protein